MSKSPSQYRKEAIDFLYEYGNIVYPRQDMEKSFDGFLENGTMVILNSNRLGIVAVCMFNLDGDLFKVEECVIHPEFRSVNTLRFVAWKALKKFPFVRKFQFQRERKYEGRKPRVYTLQKLFGGK